MATPGSDPFRTLGVSYSATQAQVYEAWRETIKRLHPDAAPHASDDTRARLTEETARVNAAYQALRTDLEGMRERFDPSRPAPQPAGRPVQNNAAGIPQYVPARIPGGWLFRRPITWILLSIAFVAGLIVLNDIGSPEPAQNPTVSTSAQLPAGWYVGNCLVGTQTVVPVRCEHQHSARIVARVGAQEYCPPETDGTVFRENVYFCIDTDA